MKWNVIFSQAKNVWSKRNGIGSLDWFYPIKQWNYIGSIPMLKTPMKNRRKISRVEWLNMIEGRKKRKETVCTNDHSEFQVKIHVPMINGEHTNCSKYIDCKDVATQPIFFRSIGKYPVVAAPNLYQLTHCTSWFSSCRQWNKCVSVSLSPSVSTTLAVKVCGMCSWRHWQNHEIRANPFRFRSSFFIWFLWKLSALDLKIT